MLWKLFQKINIILYNILGSKRSSQLVTSPLGKIVFALFFKGKGTRIYTTHEGVRLAMDPEEAMSLGVALLGSHNHFESNVLKTLVRPGDTVVDVGAFIGEESLLFEKLVGKEGIVYAFEPSPTHVKRLLANMKLNASRNIRVIRLALSNKQGVVPFYEAGSGSSFVQNEAEHHIGKKHIKPIRIMAITLNDYVKRQKIRHVDFIKIDVEGWDLQVLKGADTILKKKDAPDVMIEVIDDVLQKAGSSARALQRYLMGFGYIPYMFTKNGLQVYTNFQTSRTPNLLFRKK